MSRGNHQQPVTDNWAGRPKYITNYIGSKKKAGGLDLETYPEQGRLGAGCFFWFGGGGLHVQIQRDAGNDRLHFCHHAAKAIVENSSVTVTEAEMDALVFDNGKTNKAHHGDVNAILQQVNADLAYFDPDCEYIKSPIEHNTGSPTNT